MTSGRQNWEPVFFLVVILAVTVIAYGPMLGGVWEVSFRTTQALNAYVLLAVAFYDAVRSVVRTQPFHLAVNLHGLLLFGLSCLALATASVTGVWPFAVLGLCLNVGALISFCFGREGVRAFYPVLAGFGALVAMVVLVPQFDGWLRLVAGMVSAWGLPILGIRADMVVQQDPFQVILVAERGAGVFNVATECNGFGIVLSSVVVTLVLSLRRRIAFPGVGLLLMGAVGLGLAFNVIRIVAIAVASLRTDIPYGLIHEGLGTGVYLLALAAVYALNRVARPGRPY